MKTETPIALIFALSPQLKFVQETRHLAMLGILLYPVKERYSWGNGAFCHGARLSRNPRPETVPLSLRFHGTPKVKDLENREALSTPQTALMDAMFTAP